MLTSGMRHRLAKIGNLKEQKNIHFTLNTGFILFRTLALIIMIHSSIDDYYSYK